MDTLAVQLYTSHYLGVFGTFTRQSAPMARKLKKNPAKQDSPPAAGRASDILPFRCSAIRAERFYFTGNKNVYS